MDEFTPDTENKGLGLAWTIIIAVAVVGAIAFGVSFFLQEQTSPNSADVRADLTEANSAEALFEQGNAFVQSGQMQEAIAAYQKAIELNPDYQAVYANLGVVYYQLEELDLAAEQYQKALELNPADGEVTYNLGALNLQRALLSGSRPDNELLNEAIALLEKALELSPDLAEPHFSLGVAYLASQQEDKALESFETFLAKDTGTDPRASQEAQRYLDTLKAQ